MRISLRNKKTTRQQTLALFFLLIGLFSCRLFDTGDESIDYVNPRGLVWDLDTLAIPNSEYTDLRGIWGSSPDDVYAVGSQDGLDGQINKLSINS